MSNSFWPNGRQHARLHCPSLTSGVYSNSYPSSRWYYLTISSLCGSLLFLPSVFPSIGVFSNELALCITWPRYWSFTKFKNVSLTFLCVISNGLLKTNESPKYVFNIRCFCRLLENLFGAMLFIEVAMISFINVYEANLFNFFFVFYFVYTIAW